jgi:hypothetical protein
MRLIQVSDSDSITFASASRSTIRKQAVDAIKRAMPEAKPSLEDQGQVYVQDPDGVRVQFADVNYKR